MKFLVLALCVVATMADPHWVTLDANEVKNVHDSWEQVKHHEVDILYAIFKDHSDIQDRFPHFHGKDLESLKGTAAFATHAGRIVGFIGEYISLLGSESNQEAIKTILNDMAHNHKNRGIPQALFNEFRGSMTSYLKAHSNWNGDVAHAWDDAFDKMYSVIFQHIH